MRKLNLILITLMLIVHSFLGVSQIATAGETETVEQTIAENSENEANNDMENELLKGEENGDNADIQHDNGDVEGKTTDELQDDKKTSQETTSDPLLKKVTNTVKQVIGLAGDGDEQEYEDEIELEDGKHVESYSFKVKGQEFEQGVTEVRNGDPFEFTINFNKLESSEMNFGPKTVLKYKLPTDFTQHFTGLTVPNRFGEVGTLQIDATNGYVLITLNEGVTEGPTVLDIDNGSFTVSGNFSANNDDWEKDIAMPNNETIKVNFQPAQGKGDTVTKSGKAYKGNTETTQKSDRIEWKVTVNTDLASTDDNPQFVDILNAFGQTSGINDAVSHIFDPATLVVKELNVSPTGEVTDGSVVYENERGNVGVGYSANNNVDNTKMTIDLEKGKAYEITYTTILNDPGAYEKVVYYNSAQYNGKSDNKNKTINFGKAIEKSAGSGPGTDLITNWTITYNGNERAIPANTKLTDLWETSGSDQDGKQVIVDDNGDKVTSNFKNHITITNPKGSSAPTPEYSVVYDEDGENFVLTFESDFDYPININYMTKPEGFTASEDFTVTNTVTHDINSVTETEDSKYKQTNLTLDKSTNKIDYHNKTMSWKITANQAGYDLAKDAYFKDTFGNKNMTLDEDSLEVWIGTDKYTKDDDGNEFTLTNNGTDGFNIKINAATNKKVEIIYTTDYIIKDVDKEARGEDYPNNVVLKDSGLPTDPKDSAQFEIRDEQPLNGSKTGSYNYETKEFSWKVLVNYNYDTVNGAKFVDKLPEEHAVKEIKVLKGNLLANGNFDSTNAEDVTDSVGVNDAIDKNEFTLELGDIDQPYYITYTTKMKDDVLPVPESGNYKVENEAQLLDSNDKPNASWKKEVEVKHSSTVLDEKNGKQVGKTDVIEWNFLYNTAQSKLKDVEITDKFGLDQNGMVNQLIDKDSVKVYKAKITNSNTITLSNKRSELLEKDEDYTIDFDQEDATFVLSFDELDHAIYVEYDSVFIGIEDSKISNELSVTYNDGEDQVGSSAVPELNFNYAAFANTSATEFIIIKTDEATGELLEGREFTIKNKNGRKLLDGKTDENGVLDFGIRFATGTYKLDEVKVDGYEALTDYEIKLTGDKAVTGPYKGLEVVNVTNTPTDGLGCTEFTLNVKDANGNPVSDVTLTNQLTGKTYEPSTNSTGEFKLKQADVNAGEYVVTTIVNGTEIVLGEVAIRYDKDCNDSMAEVKQDPCNQFEVTLTDIDGKPLIGVKVTLKDKDTNGQNVNVTSIGNTNSQGKTIFISSDVPAGDYKVYQGEVYLGEITVTYVGGDCTAGVTFDLKVVDPTCEDCTIQIQDRSGKPREGVNVYITYEENGVVKYLDYSNESLSKANLKINNNTVSVPYIETDQEGKVKFPNNEIKAGIQYTVYEATVESDGNEDVIKNPKKIGDFTITDNCTVIVKPTQSGGGGGGWIPPVDPEEPVDPENPGDGEEPVDQESPGEEDPQEPVLPEQPGKEDPTKPEKPEKPSEESTTKKIIKNNKDNIIIKTPDGKDNPKGKVTIDEDGKIVVEDFEPGKYDYVIEYDGGDKGEDIFVGTVTITVTEDGEVTITEEDLIDPYGKITDKETGELVGGVELEIFYADTERNKEKGRTPGSSVNLPEVPGFLPSNNKNPQISTDEVVWNDEVDDYGNYAWLVPPEGDYYIVAKRPGYEDYTSPIISVEWEVIKHNFEMDPLVKKPDPEDQGEEDPQEPVLPEQPGKEDPKQPGKDPSKPGVDGQGSNQGDEVKVDKDGKPKGDEGEKLVQTGEARNLYATVGGVISIMIGLALLIYTRKRKPSL